MEEVVKQVCIENISNDLKGEGALENKKYSFPYTSIGDLVSFVEKGKRKRKYVDVTSIVKSSPNIAKCSSFTKCGGCAAQHIVYEEQLKYKTEGILEKFNTLLGVELKKVIPQEIYHYRSRMDFAVFPGPIIGQREVGNFRKIVDIPECEIQSKWANEELALLRGLVAKYPELPRSRKEEKGYLKYITIRKANYTDDSMVIFTFVDGFQDTEEEKQIVEEVLRISNSNNIVFCYNRPQSEVSADGIYKVIKGNYFYKERVMNKEISVPFNSFFQPNLNAFLPIIEFIQAHLKAGNKEILLDIFCGTGFFSITLGDYFQELYGFDIVLASIETAIQNIKQIFPEKKYDFRVVDLLQMKSEILPADKVNQSIAILDPPRNGIGNKMLEFLAKIQLDEIIYVSCNPSSQLEDLLFLKNFYSVEKGMITDPYPHTPHLESIVVLKKRSLLEF